MDKPVFWDESEVDEDINTATLGIRRFAMAMIIRAILDTRHTPNRIRNNANITRDDMRTAKEWLMLSSSTEPASFAWCCAVLNTQVNLIRKRLASLPKEDDVKRFFNY